MIAIIGLPLSHKDERYTAHSSSELRARVIHVAANMGGGVVLFDGQSITGINDREELFEAGNAHYSILLKHQ